MHRIFQQYLNQLALAADKDQFREAIKAFANEFGLTSTAYLTIPRTVNHRTRVISTYSPDWVTHYMGFRYWRSDPVMHYARRQPVPFCWGSDLTCPGDDDFTTRFFDEAASHGIRKGFTIPIHVDHVPIAAMTFATDRGGREYRNCVRRYAAVFQFASYCFHEHVRAKLNRNHANVAEQLSHRQNECMELSALGKSGPDIAEILRLKPRTVTYHLQEAKKKLGARTILQARISYNMTGEGRGCDCSPPLSD
jgi:DNA-binding CsgD family transcriptional regulator